jgi:hypothetical protein
VNFIDVYSRKGRNPAPTPFTPGNEGAGEIVAIGEGVSGFKTGDRVAYVGTLGAYGRERDIEAKFVVKLPKAISYEAAAAMMLKGLMAQYLLRQTYKVKAGDTLLVDAAAGGTGLARPLAEPPVQKSRLAILLMTLTPTAKRPLANPKQRRRLQLTRLRRLVAAQNVQKPWHSHTLKGF